MPNVREMFDFYSVELIARLIDFLACQSANRHSSTQDPSLSATVECNNSHEMPRIETAVNILCIYRVYLCAFFMLQK